MFEKPIPVEVGRKNNTKRQVINSMNIHDSPYGIIVSQSRKTIEKEDDIIYIPTKTFSCI